MYATNKSTLRVKLKIMKRTFQCKKNSHEDIHIKLKKTESVKIVITSRVIVILISHALIRKNQSHNGNSSQQIEVSNDNSSVEFMLVRECPGRFVSQSHFGKCFGFVPLN